MPSHPEAVPRLVRSERLAGIGHHVAAGAPFLLEEHLPAKRIDAASDELIFEIDAALARPTVVGCPRDLGDLHVDVARFAASNAEDRARVEPTGPIEMT